jgi:O-antigen/teichoic acid export membrane protein
MLLFGSRRSAVVVRLSGFSRLINAFLPSAALQKDIVALADQGTASITNFLTSVIVGRACMKEQLGLYTLGFSILFFMLHAQNSLVSLPYTVRAPRYLKDDSLGYYSGTTLVCQLIWSALVVALLISIGIVLSLATTGANGISSVIWTLAATSSVILFRQYVRRFCFAHLRMGTALLLDSSVAVIQLSGLLCLAHLRILSASTAYMVTGVACALTCAVWFTSSRKLFKYDFAQLASVFQLHWSFGKWLLTSGLVIAAATQAYPWLLSHFQGVGAVGVLSACLGVAYLINPLVIGAENVVGPKSAHVYAQGGIKRLRRTVVTYTLLLGAALGLYSLLLICCGDWIVSVIYGHEYTGNGVIVATLAVAQLAAALAMPVGFGLMAIENSRAIMISSLIALFITVICGVWMVRSFGVLGAAVSMSLALTASLVYCWIVFFRATKAA